MIVLLVKSHVKGHFRKDGTYIKDYDNKVQKKTSIWDDVREYATPKKQVALFSGLFSAGSGGFFPSKKKEAKGQNDHGSGSLFGGSYEPPKPKAYHPQNDEHGKPMPIYNPSIPSAESTWADPMASAVFTPGSDVPSELNGVPFSKWEDHPRTLEGWDYVDGVMDDLDEPVMRMPFGKDAAAGVVIEEPDGRVWVVHPTNGFAGYRATFPKGHADEDMSFQAAAIKEAFEESGLKVQITGLIGDVERGQTMTRYYRAKRVGGTPSAMGWESQAVSLVPREQVADVVNHHFDKKVSAMAGFTTLQDVENADGWEKVGKQSGTNPGGEFTDETGKRWYCKFPKNPDIAMNEVLAGKLYRLAGVRVPIVKLIEMDGDVGVASKMIPGVKTASNALTSGYVPGVNEGFAADAWLANWDVAGTGYDNLLVDPAGHAVRIDAGGSLLYRAQGAPKGSAFTDKVGEIASLRDTKNIYSSNVFKGVTKADIVAGVKKIAAIPDEKIVGLVNAEGPGGPATRLALANRLIARKKDLMARFLA